MTCRIVLGGFFTLAAPLSAYAHGGHLGELAGHAHWVGVAAIAGAALVAGAAAWIGKKAKADDAAEDDTGAEDKEPAGEATA